jgi:hypothetical protein
MKKLIQTAGEYKLFAEVRSVDLVPGTSVLQFTTTHDGSKYPEDEQVKLQLILGNAELLALKDLLNDYGI